MRFEREYFFSNLDDLMEEHFWMFAKCALYQEKNPDFKFGMTIFVGEESSQSPYSIKMFFDDAKEGTKNNSGISTGVQPKSARDRADD